MVLVERIKQKDRGNKKVKLIVDKKERTSNEREDKMKKDIEWLKESIDADVDYLEPLIPRMDREKSEGRKEWHEGLLAGLKDIRDKIDQLDEPEVLSQGLPVIPKFVAEYIDFAKRNTLLIRVMELASTRGELPKWKKEYDWISANDEKFVRAWLNGFTVEEEQKYIVEIGKSIYNTTTYGQIGGVGGQKTMMSVYASDEGVLIPNRYTKQEILKVKNGMDIFKVYAVKVEELEE